MPNVVVIGGGIVGLSTARALLRRGARGVTVLEQGHAIAVGNQTGNNSGVVHAGIYYKKGSLKAKLCARGLRESVAYFEQHKVAYRKCGKLIVARNDEEVLSLERIFANATANEVPGIRWLDRADFIRKVEPAVTGVAAIHSPETAIVDWGDVARAYAREVRELGGLVLLGSKVTGLCPGTPVNVRVQSPDGVRELTADKVVCCAGVESDRIATLAGGSYAPRIVPVRGEYLRIVPARAGILRTNVYPVPNGGVPFLGVHFTPTMRGELLVGPNAVPALARDGSAFSARDTAEMLAYGGFWRLAAKHARFAVGELYRSVVLPAAVREARSYVPSLNVADFERVSWSGVRAQAVNDQGELVDDFLFNRHENVVLARNAPSPAATSSLPIGEHIADQALS